jgi:hypothetical protein
MNAILYAIVMWVLLQLLVVWFCARVVVARELDLNDYLELKDYLVRSGLDAHPHEPQQQSLPDVPPHHHHVPPAGIARA